MPKVFTSKSQKVGALGESMATFYLKRRGFVIIERNFTRICGEIDIVASFKGKYYFFEVKSVVTRENVTHVTNLVVRPEDNAHPAKLAKLYRTVELYLAEKRVAAPWQIDLLCIYLDVTRKTARVTRLENI